MADEGFEDGPVELPENVPPGFLGERAPDLRRIDTFEPSLNAGLIDESSNATRALWVVLALALIVTQPIAWWFIWRSKRLRTWVKVVVTLLGLVWAAAFAIFAITGRTVL
jgi:hypothetical protein